MIEEPYRWVEAIANRREYIDHQLAGGSPIAAMSYREGILLFTLGRERQKLFEIYDRIGLGAIGHPGDIERLRMAAIEVTSAEGFTRSAHDVSLRRLANYSLSPVLKAAFEQVYGAPYLTRLLFAELGRGRSANVFLRLDYDGSIRSNGGTFGRSFEDFGVIAGTTSATTAMETFLAEKKLADLTLAEVLPIAAEAWTRGHFALSENAGAEPTTPEKIAAHQRGEFGRASLEVAIMESAARTAATWRALSDLEVRHLLGEQ